MNNKSNFIFKGASDIRDLNDRDIEELHLLDAAATLEVNQEAGWHSRKRGIRIPFVAQVYIITLCFKR